MSKIAVSLPDGSELEVDEGEKVVDVAYRIGQGLGDDCVAGYIDDELVGKEHRLEDGDELQIVTQGSEGYLDVIRHTSAHVLAQALKRTYDEVRLAIGPPTDDGFYYDIEGPEIEESDLSEIEKKMEDIIEEDYNIERTEVDWSEALEMYDSNPYKRDILRNEAEDDRVSLYKQGEFTDLCRGGHLESTGQIPCFKLLEVSGSYWRGDESRETLTRVHGTAFRSEEDLEEYMEMLRVAEERNHRVIGRKMDLFEFPEHSPAPQYLPKGMNIISELKEYVRDKNHNLGYEEVWTPELNRTELFERSGHYDAFCTEGEMFYWEQDGTEYGLKPMNCANHASLFSRTVESYEDLPARFSEFGTVYRHERSGSGSGLFRARGFTQDDGHAFVREDQLKSEVESTLAAIDDVLTDTFNLEPKYKLETQPEDCLGSDEIWEKATDALVKALENQNLEYEVNEGEGAFYGPKIGADVSDLLDREWTLGTVQVDFNIPRQMELEYIDEKNESSQPIMIHRALIGSYERFLAILIERTDGILPTWVAPTQIRIITVSEESKEYAHEIHERLNGFRTEIDDSDQTIEKKIRTAHKERVSYMVIVGEDEQDNDTISVRDAFENETRGVEIEDFVDLLSDEVDRKSNDLSVVERLKR